MSTFYQNWIKNLEYSCQNGISKKSWYIKYYQKAMPSSSSLDVSSFDKNQTDWEIPHMMQSSFLCLCGYVYICAGAGAGWDVESGLL